MPFKPLALWICLLFLSACSYKPGPLSTTLSQGETGKFWFTSNDAYDLTSYNEGKTLTIDGTLNIPENHNGSAVIISHGSGGLGPLHAKWADFLNENGFATLTLNHFPPRDVINVLHSQVRVTEFQMAYDILNGFRILSSHPRIKTDKIFHMGWSKGAIAGLIASTEDVQKLIGTLPQNQKIAGFIEFYPWCGFRSKLKTTSPITILHGTSDDYTPIAMCNTLVEDIKSTGSNIEVIKFDGAYHGFDNWEREVKRNDYITIRKTSEDCTLNIAPQSLQVKTLDGQFAIDTYENRKAYLVHCAEKGVMYGGAPQYRGKTEKLVLNLLK